MSLLDVVQAPVLRVAYAAGVLYRFYRDVRCGLSWGIAFRGRP